MIKSIIFDFGDVFVNLDKPATKRLLGNFGMEDWSEETLQKNNNYEKGLISTSNFIEYYTKSLPPLSRKEFVECWNSVLLDFPQYRLDFIKTLAEENKYQLILLSNTNEIHIDWIKEHVPFFEEFKECFDRFYLSHEINFRKPDAEIYEFVLMSNYLQPSECLFIDDTKANTEAASELGIHVWNLDPEKEDITQLFKVKKELF
ncbi:MAG: HAD family phosphatase [Gillisia sp.]